MSETFPLPSPEELKASPNVRLMLEVLDAAVFMRAANYADHDFVRPYCGDAPRSEHLKIIKVINSTLMEKCPELGLRTALIPSLPIITPAYNPELAFPEEVLPALPPPANPTPLSRSTTILDDDLIENIYGKKKKKAPGDEARIYYLAKHAPWVERVALRHTRSHDEITELVIRSAVTTLFLELWDRLGEADGQRKLHEKWDPAVTLGSEFVPHAVITGYKLGPPRRAGEPAARLASMFRPAAGEKVALYLATGNEVASENARAQLASDLKAYCDASGVGRYLVVS
ncbi:hypothetical protein EP7_004268 [Isosphaeraceae bacterium EP7]